MTEFLVLALALLPLFLLIPLIGKYQDLVHFTQMAARYVSFDAMVRNEGQNAPKPDSMLADEVRRRFFSQSSALIKTGDTAADLPNYQNHAWHSVAGRHLISSFNDIQVSRSVTGDGTHPVPFAFTFGSTGIQTARVSVQLANVPPDLELYKPFQQLDLKISRQSSVLVNGWSGAGADDVERRFNTKSLVAVNYVPDPLVTALNILFQIPPGIELGGSPPKLGKVDFWQDRVPARYLKDQ